MDVCIFLWGVRPLDPLPFFRWGVRILDPSPPPGVYLGFFKWGGHCPPLVGRHKKVGGTTKSKVGAGVYFSPGSGGAVGRHFS